MAAQARQLPRRLARKARTAMCAAGTDPCSPAGPRPCAPCEQHLVKLAENGLKAIEPCSARGWGRRGCNGEVHPPSIANGDKVLDAAARVGPLILLADQRHRHPIRKPMHAWGARLGDKAVKARGWRRHLAGAPPGQTRVLVVHRGESKDAGDVVARFPRRDDAEESIARKEAVALFSDAMRLLPRRTARNERASLGAPLLKDVLYVLPTQIATSQATRLSAFSTGQLQLKWRACVLFAPLARLED